MIWIWPVLLGSLALVALLIGLRRYERESALAAREEIAALREELAALRERVQALEAIAANEPLPLDVEAPREANTTPPARERHPPSRS
jgi:hypothetical protein